MRDQGLVRVMGGDRSGSQTCLWFVSMTCSMYKEPLVYIIPIIALEIVQYSFVNPIGISGGCANL